MSNPMCLSGSSANPECAANRFKEKIAELERALAEYQQAEMPEAPSHYVICSAYSGAWYCDCDMHVRQSLYVDALAKRCARLTVENESLRAECGVRQIAGYAKGKCDQDATIDALTVELEAARKDAERYRWVRSPEAAVAEICNCALNTDTGFTFMEGDMLDAAIDAALTAEKGKS